MNDLNDIPKSFEIARQTIKVEILDDYDREGSFGHFSSARNTIYLYKYIISDNEKVKLSEEQIIITFYHELMHVFNFFWNTECDEGLAQVFANFIYEYKETKL